MPTVRCACPKCQMQLQLEGELPMRGPCPACQTVITVGAAGGSSGARSWTNRVKPSAAKVSPVGVSTATPPPAPVPQEGPVVRVRRPQPKVRVTPYIIVGLAALALVGGLIAFLNLRGGKPKDDDNPQKPQTNGFGSQKIFKAKPIEVDPQQQRINQAIKRGAAYLKKQIFDGTSDYYFYDPGASSRLGVLALAGLTLLECRDQLDLDPEIPKAVEKVVETIRGEAPKESFRFTYSLALAILFLDRWCESKDRKTEERDVDLIRRLATRMIAAQNENGGWEYYCPQISEDQHQQILKTLNAGQAVPRRKREVQKDDNSINQFCTLALWAARKHGIRTDTVLKAIEARYRTNQNADGSWGYKAKDTGPLRDATTCAGLIGLAVGHGVDKLREEEDLKKHIAKGEKSKTGVDVTKADPAIVKALAYITPRIGLSPRVLSEKQRRIRHEHTEEMMKLFREWHAAQTDEEREAIKRQVEKLDNARLLRGTYFNADSWGDLYFLWSVERTAEIFGLTKINGRDWYAWGSEIILQFQQEDGSWRDRFPGVCDTCFALLFLRKANLAKDLTNKLRGVRTAPGVSAAPPRWPVPDQPRRRPQDA